MMNTVMATTMVMVPITNSNSYGPLNGSFQEGSCCHAKALQQNGGGKLVYIKPTETSMIENR